MKSGNFKLSDTTSVLSFLHNFKADCDSNGFHEDVAMWLFQYFMNDRARAGLGHEVYVTKEDDIKQEGKLTIYCQAINYLLATHTTDCIITKADMTKFKQLQGMFAATYSEVLLEEALRFRPVYDESSVYKVAVELLHESGRFSVCTFRRHSKIQCCKA